MAAEEFWKGLRPEAREKLILRNYRVLGLEERLAREGLETSAALEHMPELKKAGAWIPGVEIIPRTVHPQRHRGVFSELGREGEGRLGEIRLWPKQWAAATLFAGSAKGFHIHPPYIPKDETPAAWFKKLFGEDEPDYSLRRYDLEQWDVMYFLQGQVEVTLCDERESLPRRRMRLFIDGDGHRGGNNAGIVVPPGVAHAFRTEGGKDLLMVYGTSIVFHPPNEGRIASQIEEPSYPEEWEDYLENDLIDND
jgi:dTDP-4-dehydrorhamnose 3,5-epimerase-like enzyme